DPGQHGRPSPGSHSGKPDAPEAGGQPEGQGKGRHRDQHGYRCVQENACEVAPSGLRSASAVTATSPYASAPARAGGKGRRVIPFAAPSPMARITYGYPMGEAAVQFPKERRRREGGKQASRVAIL